MRTLILITGLLAVGCLTPEQKQKALRDGVVGEYEIKNDDLNTHKLVFLENGVHEYIINGKKYEETKWEIVDVEIHVVYTKRIEVYRVNKDKSITSIEFIEDGNTNEIPKDKQATWKKIN